ncbi:hypothetical protein [Acinetobacter baumannii]|uniref:hypothetical protein n=1 Tax=Acinetobacter baumannii TaxID=470 RepID=UPI00396B2DE8
MEETYKKQFLDILKMRFRRLRKANLLCGCIIVFAHSNPFDNKRKYYYKSSTSGFVVPTDNVLTG